MSHGRDSDNGQGQYIPPTNTNVNNSPLAPSHLQCLSYSGLA